MAMLKKLVSAAHGSGHKTKIVLSVGRSTMLLRHLHVLRFNIVR